MNIPNALRAIALAILALLFIAVVTSVAWPEGPMDDTTNEDVGKSLFGTSNSTGYGLIVLFIGLLLLVALLGGVFLAKEESE
ncbi:MAG: hypothetical protein ACUVT7_01295 [Thermoplasmata archaeon]